MRLLCFLLPALLIAQDLLIDSNLQYYLQHKRAHYKVNAVDFLFPMDRDEAIAILQKDSSQQGKLLLQQLRYQLPTKKGLLKVFYRNGYDFLHYQEEAVQVSIQPVLYLSGGIQKDSVQQFISRNTRGIEVQGQAWKKVAFYFRYLETQAILPSYLLLAHQRYGSIPSAWSYKKFKEKGIDYSLTRGYLIYKPNKHFRIKFGHDKLFLGYGYQSLWFSNYAPEHLQLQLQARFKKFHYLSHFAQFIEYFPGKADIYGDFPRKYGAFHALTIMPSATWRITFFESVIFAKRAFDFQYLNPIIFYRSIEHSLGSPDNVFLGLMSSVVIKKQFRPYVQLLIDDYNFSKRKEGKNWWGNKYAFQAGIYYFTPIEGLQIQLEHNRIRPYTYSHVDSVNSYSHYKQPLAHPYGANLEDYHCIIRYLPSLRYGMQLRLSYTRQGISTDSLNYGEDIFVPNRNIARLFNVQITQGQLVTYQVVEFRLWWQPWRFPLVIEAVAQYRKAQQQQLLGWLQLRYQIPYQDFRR